MKQRQILSAALGLGSFACAANAAEVKIENAVARVVVVAEQRSDISVEIDRGTAQLPPLKVQRSGDRVAIDGGLASRIRGCHTALSGLRGRTAENPPATLRVNVVGIGQVALSEAPVVRLRVPDDAIVIGGGATFGRIGSTSRLEFHNHGCGDWTIGDVSGRLKIVEKGSGNVTARSGRNIEVAMIGSGDVTIGRAAGSGEVNIIGSGDVRIEQGQLAALEADITGSGDVRFDGQSNALDASATGSGTIYVARVTGPVNRRVGGSGDIRIGN